MGLKQSVSLGCTQPRSQPYCWESNAVPKAQMPSLLGHPLWEGVVCTVQIHTESEFTQVWHWHFKPGQITSLHHHSFFCCNVTACWMRRLANHGLYKTVKENRLKLRQTPRNAPRKETITENNPSNCVTAVGLASQSQGLCPTALQDRMPGSSRSRTVSWHSTSPGGSSACSQTHCWPHHPAPDPPTTEVESPQCPPTEKDSISAWSPAVPQNLSLGTLHCLQCDVCQMSLWWGREKVT